MSVTGNLLIKQRLYFNFYVLTYDLGCRREMTKDTSRCVAYK